MADKIYFMYERMEPYKYPEPRDIRTQLEKNMISKYKNLPISKINQTTEFVLKSIIPKDGSPERPLLKYKVINLDWDDTRKIKDVKFEGRFFKWTKNEEPIYEGLDNGGY